MRSKVTAFITIVYLISVNLYVYGFYFTDIDKFYMKLFGFYWPAVLFFGYLLYNEHRGYENDMHRTFNILGKYSVWFKLILITFTYQIPIKSPVIAYFIFDGGVLLTLSFVFISGLHRGLFK